MSDPLAAPLFALGLGLLLGLRHATDPDHLTAVVLLVAGDAPDTRRAGVLGLAWGLGHACTCTALGLAVIAASPLLPGWLHSAAEMAVGGIVVLLALRLLIRWGRGRLHAHAHAHGPIHHSHPHVHEGDHALALGPVTHQHAHADGLGRSPWEAFSVGAVHGIGGSAAAGALLVAPIAERSSALGVLACFSLATAVAMAAASTALGALLQGSTARRVEAWVPVIGVASLLFGLWYAAQAWLASGAAA